MGGIGGAVPGIEGVLPEPGTLRGLGGGNIALIRTLLVRDGGDISYCCTVSSGPRVKIAAVGP